MRTKIMPTNQLSDIKYSCHKCGSGIIDGGFFMYIKRYDEVHFCSVECVERPLVTSGDDKPKTMRGERHE